MACKASNATGRAHSRLGGALAAAVLVSGVANADIPSSAGIISACYQQINGQLRVIDPGAGQTCLASEMRVSWNQVGPAGAAGATGATGPMGPAGASAPSDGVITIDQAKALAGSITAGDTAGFPVTLSEPGSYRLSGNLTVPPGADGIVFATDGVTLDLNGFTISGPPGEYGLTDASVARSRIAIRNGQVNGFSNSVRLMASNHVVVENMMLSPDGAAVAVVVGGFSRVQRNTVVGTGLIQATCPSIVTENVSDGYITSFVTDSDKQCIRYHNRSLSYGDPISE